MNLIHYYWKLIEIRYEISFKINFVDISIAKFRF